MGKFFFRVHERQHCCYGYQVESRVLHGCGFVGVRMLLCLAWAQLLWLSKYDEDGHVVVLINLPPPMRQQYR